MPHSNFRYPQLAIFCNYFLDFVFGLLKQYVIDQFPKPFKKILIKKMNFKKI